MEVDFMQRQFLMYGALALGLAGLIPGTGLAQNRPAGDIPGPIDSIQDLQDTAKMLFKMADTNNDGQTSPNPARASGHALRVGGCRTSGPDRGRSGGSYKVV
jgi:hypothetical protein